MFLINEYREKVNNFFEVMVNNKDLADIKLSDEKWTLKQMVGHLIDSASNNHQRIIRLQIENRINFPVYDPEVWKDISKINGYNFLELTNLWKGYNYLLLHLTENIDEKCLNNIWEMNGKELTLRFIVEDYFGRHMDWHVELYKNRILEINKK